MVAFESALTAWRQMVLGLAADAESGRSPEKPKRAPGRRKAAKLNARLKAKAAVDGEGAGEIIAEEFDECSFLFAKAQTPRDSPRVAEIR